MNKQDSGIHKLHGSANKRKSSVSDWGRKWLPLAGATAIVLALSQWTMAAATGSGRFQAPGRKAVVLVLSVALTFAVSALVARARRLLGGADDYKRIVDNAPIGIYRTTVDGRILMANPALVRMLGYDSVEEITQASQSGDWYQSDYPRAEFRKTLDTKGEFVGLEHSWRRRNGTLVYVRENARAEFDQEGEVVYYEGTVEDITARKNKEEELKKSEEQYKSLFENANDAILIFDPETEAILAANGRACDLYGFSKEELKERRLSQFTRDVEDGRKRIEELLTDGARQTDTVHHNKWGEELYLQANSSIIPYNGKTAVMANFTDVSEQRHAEASARDSRMLLGSLIDSLPQDIFCKDMNGSYTVVNRAFCERAGRTAEEILGKTDFDLYSEETARKGASEDRNVIESRLTTDVIEEIPKSNGTKAYVEVIRAPRLDHKGEVAGVLGLFWEVTDRKRAEQALEDERDLLGTLMDSIPDPIYFKDAQGRFIRVNKAFADRVGISAVGAAVGKTDFDFFDPAYARASSEADRRLVASGTESINQVEKISIPGQPDRWFSTTRVPIRTEDGKTKGLVGIARDITEKKLAEDSLEQNLESLLSIVSRVSQGDLTVRPAESDDTLGKIATSVNQMLESFSSMLTKVKQIGLAVSSSATEILAASEQIAAGAQRQADEVTDTSSTVEEMAATMSQVSRNAEASAQAAKQALNMAETGERSVRDTSEAMVRINTAVLETAEKMKTLAKRTNEISEIMDLINEIAAQTNLLSLNAAIEAAHAGEAGLGFSVVAEEIRKLAERSARATRDVSSIIKAIQVESAAALAAMENGMKEVSGGTKMSNEGSRSLQNISSVVRQSAELIAEISAAAEEQARVTRNLASAMQTISSITLETSAGAQETATTLQGMVGLSEQLNESISIFKVAEDYSHPFSYSRDGYSNTDEGGGPNRY